MSQLPEHHEDHPDVISSNARRGLVLFVIYLSLYMGFVFLNVFAPATMHRTTIEFGGGEQAWELSLGGPNLAVVSGIGLIFAAIVMSLIYMRWTRRPSV